MTVHVKRCQRSAKFISRYRLRRHSRRREHLFKSKSHLHFRIPPKREKSRYTRLRVGGALVSDQSQLLEVWTNHFQSLAHSQVNVNPDLSVLNQKLSSLFSSTFHKEEYFLDVPFSNGEIALAVHKIKLKKSAGPDDLTTEHIRYGGPAIVMWLTKILNSIIELEQIPPSLKSGITNSCIQGRWQGPLRCQQLQRDNSELRYLKGFNIGQAYLHSAIPLEIPVDHLLSREDDICTGYFFPICRLIWMWYACFSEEVLSASSIVSALSSGSDVMRISVVKF